MHLEIRQIKQEIMFFVKKQVKISEKMFILINKVQQIVSDICNQCFTKCNFFKTAQSETPELQHIFGHSSRTKASVLRYIDIEITSNLVSVKEGPEDRALAGNHFTLTNRPGSGYRLCLSFYYYASSCRFFIN